MADYDDGCRVKSISIKCPTKKSRTSSSLPISRRENARTRPLRPESNGVWDYPGQNVLNGTSKSKLSLHPTVKPVALVADAILDCSNRNGVILDPFGGAGTTLIAAEKTGRRACLIEIDPRYVDVTIKRWQNLTAGRLSAPTWERRTRTTANARATRL
jgi:DNA modification methylase